MVGCEHEDLVDAAGLGGDVHRTEVMDREAVVAVERGIQVGDDADRQLPASSTASSAGGVASSLPGQNGHGRFVSASIWRPRGAKSVGRSARSATIVTQRPVSWFRRI